MTHVLTYTIALFNAVFYKRSKNVRLLLEKGSDIKTRVVQNDNMSVFHQAVANNDSETLTVLLEHVLNIKYPCEVLARPSFKARTHFLTHFPFKVFDASGLKNGSNVTVLKAAVDKGGIQIILLLLAHSCSIVGAKSATELLQDYEAFAALPDYLKVLSALSHPRKSPFTH